MADIFEPAETEDAQRKLRNSLGNFATGVTIVTMRDDDGSLVALTANSFSSVSLDPPLVLWSIGDKSRGYEAFQRAKHFCISILSAEQGDLAMSFAKSEGPKFENVAYSEGLGGAPIIDNAITVFECSRFAQYPGGDHVILVGKVEKVRVNEGEPLLFYQGKFGAFAT